jgi:PAS domain S-box-containing protein
MNRNQTTRIWHSAAQLLFGFAALALLTLVCFGLELNLTATAFAYLILIVLLSLMGSFIPSVALCLIAVGYLHYFFAGFRLNYWGDAAESIAFLITSLVVTGLVRRARRLAAAALESQKEVRALRDQLRLVIDTIPALVWSKLPDGAADFLNQRFRDYTGLSLEEGRGWGWMNAFHPEDRAIDEWRAALAAGEPFEKEARLRRADGEYRWFMLRAVPLRDAQGNIVKWYGTSTDIEERQRAEGVLREQARLLDLTHDTVFVRDMNDVITYWNRGAEELYGWTREEAVGNVTHQLLQTRFPEPLEEIAEKLLRTGRWEGELVHTKRDVTQVIVASRWAVQRDEQGNPIAVLETNNDISERKRAEYLTGQVFESTPDGVAIIGRNFRYQRVNAVYGRRWGVPVERIVGMHIADLPGRAVFEETAEPRLNRCFEGEEVRFAGWFTNALGRRYVAVTCSPLRPQSGRVEAALVISRDLTEHVLASEALREAQAALAHVTRVTTLGEVTASFAHELNQPLAAIVNNANACLGLLPRGGHDLDEVRDALADMVSDAARASAIIERVRGLAKRSAPEKVPVQLGDVVDDVVALAAAESVARRVAIHTEVAADLPGVLGDRVQLQQVLLNLVVNGMDAMSSVAERERLLEIRGRPDTQDGRPAARISVQDRGSGLDAGQQERLFEAFYTTKPHGMGMGLAISRSIIEAHGGRLWADANQGPGATFSFSLPAAAASAGS